jgi:hypothetical protein
VACAAFTVPRNCATIRVVATAACATNRIVAMPRGRPRTRSADAKAKVERNMLVEHEVPRDGRLMATPIVRGVVRKGRETVDPSCVASQPGPAAPDPAARARLDPLPAQGRCTAGEGLD